MFSRLEVKITVSLVLILAAMMAVYGYWTGSRQMKVYVQALSDNLRVLSRIHAEDAAHFMVIEEYAGLESHMMDAAHMPEVETIQVTETDGKLLCNIVRNSRDNLPRLNYRLRKIKVPSSPQPILQQEGNHLVSWSPVVAGTHLGWVKITLSLNTANRLRLATWQSSLQIGMLWILVGTLLMIRVVKKPLQAVRELSEFAHELQRRKGAQASVKRGVYEIDMLCDALNYSSQELLLSERRLLAEQERLSVTLKSIADGVIATDTRSRIVLVNHVAEQLTGWTEKEALGRDLAEVFRLADHPAGDASGPLLASVLTEMRTVDLPGHHTVVSLNRETRTVTVNGAPIIDNNRQLAGMVLVVRDVSEKEKMEEEKRGLAEQLMQAQKMEAIGQLAGGVAHDFNNMLGVIIGHAELAMMIAAQLPQLQDRLKGILDAANRSADITRQLLAFSRQQHAEPKVLDLNDTISRMLKMLHRLIGEDIDLGWSPGFNLHRVKLDPAQLDQIMANLCVNARDAISGVGKIDIHTENVSLHNHDHTKHNDTPPGQYVMLVVKDSGCGMSKEVMERIFEPFYTTKQMGRGTGLGLATVFGIVKQNNGNIVVHSAPGQGATFTIYFPAVADVSEEVEKERAVTEGGTETILLVEDEQAINDLSTAMLTRLGYTVLSAQSPEEALRLAANERTRIDLLLTDIIMPGMNGRDLSQRLQASHLEMKCLFMSGYTTDVIAARGKVEGDICFLQKPFTMQSLAAKVREALSASQQPPSPPLPAVIDPS